MAEQLQWLAGKSDYENWGLSQASDTEAYAGRLGKARELNRRAVDSAKRVDDKEGGAVDLLERRRFRHPRPEASQSGIRESAVKSREYLEHSLKLVIQNEAERRAKRPVCAVKDPCTSSSPTAPSRRSPVDLVVCHFDSTLRKSSAVIPNTRAARVRNLLFPATRSHQPCREIAPLTTLSSRTKQTEERSESLCAVKDPCNHAAPRRHQHAAKIERCHSEHARSAGEEPAFSRRYSPEFTLASHVSNSRSPSSHCNRCRSFRSRIFFSSGGSRSNVMFAG
jgi:hypothetical protein